MKIAVIGAGQMGNGIAHVFAQSGHDVTLIDIASQPWTRPWPRSPRTWTVKWPRAASPRTRRRPRWQRITTSTDMAAGVKNAELVVEAATENVDLKLKIFKDLDAHAPAGCILATNTSSISITRIAAVTKRPGAGDRHALHEPGSGDEVGGE
jgi:3-hydroxybutyryl-CoA dehydrogenase